MSLLIRIICALVMKTKNCLLIVFVATVSIIFGPLMYCELLLLLLHKMQPSIQIKKERKMNAKEDGRINVNGF